MSMLTVLTSSVRKYENETFEEQLIKLPLDNLNLLINWEANREPDNQKILEIIQSINCDKHSIQIVYCFQKNDNYIIIDGGHRVEAYKKMLITSPLKIKDYLNDSVIISLMVNAPIKYIVDRFVEINKATPLPELYKSPFTKSTEILRSVVPEAVKEFKKTYKCSKTTNKPHLPNYNPAILTNDLFDVLNNDVEDISEPLTPELIMNVFAVINTNYKTKLLAEPTSIKNGIKLTNKALDVNCFIFLLEWRGDFVKIFNRLGNNDLYNY